MMVEITGDTIEEVLSILTRGALTDGAHHKQWAITEAARTLLGEDGFRNHVSELLAHGYLWQRGVAP